MRRALPVLLLVVCLALPATAASEPQRGRERPFTVEKGRELYNATALPKKVGDVSISPAEGIASITRTVTFTLTDPGAGTVDLALPGRFGARSQNGRSYVPGRPQGTRQLTAGNRSISFDVDGLPAGTYALPIRRDGRTIGTARFRLYAPRKEGLEEGRGGAREARAVFGRIGRVPIDSSDDDTEESETFVALSPLDSQRVVAYGNDINSATFDGGLNVSNDGGATWAHPQFPELFNTPSGVDHELPSGDPILAADDLGNVWAGGLTLCTSVAAQSRIFVNRIASGTSNFQSHGAGLPRLHTGSTCDGDDVIQDKPQMTIDNSPSSPTYGRLYVTWDDPDNGGGVNEIISFCDTRRNGYPDAGHCDTGANWSTPAVVSDSTGSYITSAVAVGPDGKVYVLWWDFSNANKISADMCDPAAHSCGVGANWGTDQTIASLSVHSGKRVPFQCDTLAQPGGRAAPVPSVAVDHSGGANNGRIYVAWSDLDLSGTTRCSGSSAPTLLQDTFDSFVASAPNFATLTTGAPASGTRGTSIITDTGDHWFPWVAVDQSTGQAYVDLYSTRDDATRTTTQFYKRGVVPGSGTTTPVTFGSLTKVSTVSSTYADQPFGGFGNDYGDYTGLDAAQGVVAPVWTQRPTVVDDGDVEVDLPASQGPHLTADAAALGEGSGADGDGKLEPGEAFTLTVPLHNNGPGALDNVSATVTAMSPGVSLSTASSSYAGSLAAGSSAPNATAYTGTLSSSVPCGVTIDFRLAVTTDQGPRAVQVAPSTLVCGTTPPPPPPTTTDTTPTPPPTGTTTTPTSPPLDRTAPRLKVTFATRVDRKGRYIVRLAATGEAAAGRATLRLATGRKRRLASGLLATSGTKPLKLVIKLRRKDLALLKRKHRLRVTLTVSISDVAGNTAKGQRTFTLRLKR